MPPTMQNIRDQLTEARVEVMRNPAAGREPEIKDGTMGRVMDDIMDQAAWLSGYSTAIMMGSTHEGALDYARKREEKISKANRR